MKKISFLILISFLSINCSKSKSSSINFTLDGKTEYEQDYIFLDAGWEKIVETSGIENEFMIVAVPKIKGTISDVSGSGLLVLNIRTADNELVVNKTYNVYNSSYANLPLNDTELCYKTVWLYATNNTFGKVKITSFDGTTLKGEFSISNLTNDFKGLSLGYCNGTKISAKTFNITKGRFTAIPF